MDKINREILRLSIPTIISNITIPLLGICDTAISGHLGSELFLSAIAVGSVMLNVVFWIFGFLRGGTTGLTANALGAGEENETAKVLYRALAIAGIAGFLFIIFQSPVFNFLWYLSGDAKEIRELVKEYFIIRIWGSPALLAIIAISGWFVGMQNTFYPMLIAIVANLINIAASCLLVYVADWGFNGVAAGTLISNWIGLGVAIVCIFWFRKGKTLKCSLKEVIKGEWWKYFSVNGNLFLRSFFIICVTMGVTAAGSRLGPLTLAVNVIVMQFFQFFSFFMDGFAYSAEAMIGIRWGAGKLSSMHQCVKKLIGWTIGTAITFSLIYYIFLNPLTSSFTDSEAVVAGVMDLAVLIGILPLISCWSFIFDGFFIGLTDTFDMMISTLIGGLFFFAFLSFDYFSIALPSVFNGNMLIWTAFLSYLLFRGLYLALRWKFKTNLKPVTN